MTKNAHKYAVVEEKISVGNDFFETLAVKGSELSPNKLYFRDALKKIWLYQANCLKLMDALITKYPLGKFDMIFADPPYLLSNGGISCQAGKMVSVNKGDWDKSRGAELNHEFNMEWLKRCQKLLNPNGTMWVSGTHHVIYSVGYAMQQLGMKILNDIIWEKPNPSPNLSCRYFTHSTETILWAAKNQQSKHIFNYSDMRIENEGKQMKSVWRFLPPANAEKIFGKHPTQKPVKLIERCILASTQIGALILDPFSGSATTGVAAIRNDRQYVGIEMNKDYLDISINRLNAMECPFYYC